MGNDPTGAKVPPVEQTTSQVVVEQLPRLWHRVCFGCNSPLAFCGKDRRDERAETHWGQPHAGYCVVCADLSPQCPYCGKRFRERA